MKSFAAIAAVAMLVNSAAAATCDSTVLTSLLTDQYIQQCSTDSGYVFTAASIPTQEIIDKMCASSACLNLLADAHTMNLTECTLPVGDNINLMADLIDYVPPRCSSASGSAATTITVGSSASSGASPETVMVPSTSTTSSSTGSTASSAASASAAASASGSSAASSTTLGAASLAIAAVGAYFL